MLGGIYSLALFFVLVFASLHKTEVTPQLLKVIQVNEDELSHLQLTNFSLSVAFARLLGCLGTFNTFP